MNTSPAGLALIMSFEGLRLERYLDGEGTPTIGYGTTASVVSPLPETCTEAQAAEWLRLFVERDVDPAINALEIPLTQNQFDALSDFVYNLGPGILGPAHTVGAQLRARNMAGAADALLFYDDPGTVDQAGLERRRQAERALFLAPARPPPPPADPMNYHWYPDQPMLGGLVERHIVQEYDRLRASPVVNSRRLGVLRGECAQLAARLETIAEEAEDSFGWLAQYHRGWRRLMLDRRAAGQRIGP